MKAPGEAGSDAELLLAHGVNRMQANRCSWYVAGAMFGLGGSFLLPLLGTLLRPVVSRLAADYPLLEHFGAAHALLFFSLLVFGLYCLNAAVERAVPIEYSCSRRQMSEPAPHARARRTARL
jgi:hypothetical protein